MYFFLFLLAVQNGLIFPALLAGDRVDLVFNPHKRLLNYGTICVLVLLGCGISLTLSLVPVFGVKSGNSVLHEHGCHLWSKRSIFVLNKVLTNFMINISYRVDNSVWLQIYGLCGCLVVSIVTIILCYGLIFKKLLTKVKNYNTTDRSSTSDDQSMSQRGNQ